MPTLARSCRRRKHKHATNPALARPGAGPGVNLDRRLDRWAAISANLDRLGIEATRIAAVDKETLAGDPALLGMGGGHVACARSHYKAMQALVDSGAPAALILEDDVEVGEEVPALLSSLEWWPGEHGLMKLESTIAPDTRIWLGPAVGATPSGRALKPIMRNHLGAYGYLIDYDAALEVLDIAPATPMPIDHLLFNLGNSHLAHRLRPLQMTPGVIRHLPYGMFGSDTGGDRIHGRKLWKPGYMTRLLLKKRWIWAAARGRCERTGVGYLPGLTANRNAAGAG